MIFMESSTYTVLVSYDYNPAKDNAVLIVGHKEPKDIVRIVNAFSGEEATALWNKLIGKKGE